MQIPRIMLAAPASGNGKTIAACGLMAGFQQMYKEVRACKCGPDYIDPMFHRTVLGVDSENLDLFFSEETELEKNFCNHAKEADITIVEGVMGYYDGMTLGSIKGSAYEIAKALRIPVILVLPCKGMAASALAVLKGLVEYQKDSNIKGVLLNRISPALYLRMKEMVEQGLKEMGHKDISVLGYLPEDKVFQLESRHLGLITPEEIDGLTQQMRHAGEMISKTVDMEKIFEIAELAEALNPNLEDWREDGTQKQKVRIAVARDRAFCFYYKENLEYLKKLGCELMFFSPMEDRHLPEGCDGLLLGGGYPELYAKELEANQEIMTEIRKQILEGLPCLAECGGFQYLQENLEDADGKIRRMAGVISASSRNQGRLVRFGYITVEGIEDGMYLKRGERIRGHEFHHWDSSSNGDACRAVKPDGKRSWPCIHAKGSLFAGYPHLHYPSNPDFARRFVEACLIYRMRR